jgi:hypothetical protein
MTHEPSRRVARLDRHELIDLLGLSSDADRGRHLWRLLQERGIEPGRLYLAEYHSRRGCWVLSQQAEPNSPSPAAAPSGPAAAEFYTQTVAWLRWVARRAAAVPTAPSYRLGTPEGSHEMSPAELAELLGGPAPDAPGVRFDAEGGWQADVSEN